MKTKVANFITHNNEYNVLRTMVFNLMVVTTHIHVENSSQDRN